MLNSFFFLNANFKLLKFELNSNFVCTRPRGAWNKFGALFPASCVCNAPPKLRYWACQSATMAMHGCSWAEVVFLTCAALTRQRAACASERATVSHWQRQYHNVLIMQHVSVLKLNP